MDHLSEHRKILEKAIAGELPDRITRDSEISVEIFHELYEEELVTAIDASSMNEGRGYINPAITLKGREYLNVLNQKREEMSLKGRVKKIGLFFLGWVGGVLSAVLTTWLGKFL